MKTRITRSSCCVCWFVDTDLLGKCATKITYIIKLIMAEIVFVLGGKLPYAYEVVTSLLTFAPGGSAYENKETRKRKDAINAYDQSLICLWSKAFGANHITARKVLTAKVWKLIVNYHLKVTNIRKKEGASSSVRTRRLQWRNENNFFVDILYD